MALVDQGNNSSPYEFENMLPLDVLAAVASETLRNEIHTNDNREKKVSPNIKRHAKKSHISGMSFEDVKSLPIKALVEKFSEMTSDELTKKYFCKCLLIPQQCTMTFKSFGNEKKACDKMKSHLLAHLQQLSADYESNKETFATVFIPKSSSTNGKHVEKLSKKSKKHVLLYPDLPQKSHKSSKKKNSVYCLKKMHKYYSLNKKETSVEFQSDNKVNLITDSVCLKRKSSGKKYDKSLNNIHIKKEPKELQDSSDGGSEESKYNSYSEYLKNTFLSGDFLDNESFDYPTVMPGISEGVSEPAASFSVSNTSNYSFLQHHNYAMTEGVTKCEKLLSQELKHFSRRNITCFAPEPIVQPQLIIRTPPFPFVHTPLLPEVAEIKEVGLEEVDSNEYDFYSDSDQLCKADGAVVKQEFDELSREETMSDPEEKFSQSIFYKTSGSVLECVENLVNGKFANSCLPEVPAAENEENLENLQRIEKELALTYIANLHAKKKKRIPDSLICQICPDKHFTAQATLIHHYRSHAGIKPYVCKICAATFTRQHSLNYHMLIHQNLSRFTCEFCGRTFRHPSHYKEHLRRHTGETPYHCTDCNLHFKTRNTFKRHLKTRHAKLLTASGIEDLSIEEYAVIKFNPKIKLGK